MLKTRQLPRHPVILVLPLLLAVLGCETSGNIRSQNITCGSEEDIPYGKVDLCGCPTPPKSVFEKTGIKFGISDLKIGQVVGGGLTFETSPKVVRAASEIAIDMQILRYSACRTARQYNYTSEQVNWQEKFNGLLSTKPNSSEIDNFYSKNPFPICMEMRGNVAVGNGSDGFYIKGNGCIKMQDNEAEGNGGKGFNIDPSPQTDPIP